jgi:AcrR family transcriptional regulator
MGERKNNMPPAISFSQDAILNEAFEIVRKEGLQVLTARKIARNLGCSTQPVYSAFGSMQKLQKAVLQKARAYAINYLLQGQQEGEVFLSMGMQYFRFAREEKVLFRLLFLVEEMALTLEKMREMAAPLIERMKQDTFLQSLSEDQLKRIGRDMWIYTHGLVALMYESELPDAEEYVRAQLYQMGRTVIEWEYQQIQMQRSEEEEL